jgi:ribonuclease HIII
MSAIVLKVNTATMQKAAIHYQAFAQKIVPYSVFRAKKNGVTITGYTSGKLMFQGNQAEQEAKLWASKVPNSTKSPTPKSTTRTTKKPSGSNLPEHLSTLSLIGSDEVGNGSYFGPLTVCAAFASHDHLAELKALGVKDSKMLTDHDIRQLAPKIRRLIPTELVILTPARYNEIQPKYNAVHMKVLLHNQVIRKLQEKIAPVKPDGVLIDQFTPEANFYKYLKDEPKKAAGPTYFTTKGEQYHLAVAAASIVSRASFLEQLDAASQALGFLIPSGAGVKSDQVAARILRLGGLELLSQYAKLHFANTKKAQALM